MRRLLLSLFLVSLSLSSWAEDGHQLWLRYQPLNRCNVTATTTSPTIDIARHELETYSDRPRFTLLLDDTMADDDGFRIQGDTIRARRDVGLLYAAYHELRQQHTDAAGRALPVEQHPAFALRLLNHWDNLDGSIERGYAGQSIFWSATTAEANCQLSHELRSLRPSGHRTVNYLNRCLNVAGMGVSNSMGCRVMG